MSKGCSMARAWSCGCTGSVGRHRDPCPVLIPCLTSVIRCVGMPPSVTPYQRSLHFSVLMLASVLVTAPHSHVLARRPDLFLLHCINETCFPLLPTLKQQEQKEHRCTSTVICGKCTTDMKMGFRSAFIWGTLRSDCIMPLRYCCAYVGWIHYSRTKHIVFRRQSQLCLA